MIPCTDCVADDDKAAAKKEKEEAKARKEEEKRMAKQDKRKSRETKRPEATELGAAAAVGTATENEVRSEEPEEKKRGGLFSRLRRSKKGRDEKPVEEHAPAGAVAALGGAGAAAGGVAAGEAAEKPTIADAEGQDEREDEVSDVDDEQPASELHPAVAVTAADEQPLAPTVSRTLRPDLERHLTELADSDEGDDDSVFDDDDDDFDDPDTARNEEELAEKGKIPLPTPSEDGLRNHPTALGHEQDPLPSVVSTDTTGAADGNLGQSEARAVAARVGAAPVNEAGGPSHNHEDVSPLEGEQHVGRDAAIAGGAGAAGIATHEATKGDETGPAPHTIGPHKSDVLNVIDPRVLPDPEKMRSGTGDETGPAPSTAGPHKSDLANVVDPRVLPDPKHLGNQKEAGSAPSPTVKTGSDEQLHSQEPSDQQQKGLRGFFSKLRRKQSKPESEMEKPKKSTEAKPTERNVLKKDSLDSKPNERNVLKKDAPASAAAVGESAGQPTSSHAGTDGPIGDDRKVSEDVSPSGGDEDELNRGRGSGHGSRMKDYVKAEFGLGSLDKGPHPKAAVTSDDDDEDQFEEARDHFDERLAPPPSFAGQKKSESPVRETKFREEV